jgi:hypothetical protein
MMENWNTGRFEQWNGGPTTIKSVVYGTIGTAIAQSTLTSLGLWLAGVPGR